MKDFKDKIDNAKDKVTAEITEATGKITGNEELELKGKLLNMKADFVKKTDIKHSVDGVKEDIIGKINDMIDKDDKE